MDWQQSDSNAAKSSEEDSMRSPSHQQTNKKLKHFKKSMICEYRRIENSTQNEDSSNSSSSSASSSSASSSLSSSTSSSAPATSFAGSAVCRQVAPPDDSSRAKTKKPSKQAKKRKSESKLIDNDLYENEESDERSGEESEVESDDVKKKKVDVKDKADKKKNEKKKKKKVYCICKSVDTERFMIACDKCDEWYHGDCVGVSQSLSKKIKAFFCHVCRVKRPALTIKYKSKFDEFLKNPSKFLLSNPGESVYLKFQKEIKACERKEAELNRKLSEQAKKASVSLKQEAKVATSEATAKKNVSEKTKDLIKKETNLGVAPSASSSQPPMSQKTSESLPANHVKAEPETQTNASSIFSFDNSPTKRYGKNNISGEDIENFVTAITKLGYDAAQLAAAARSTQIDSTELSEHSQSVGKEAVAGKKKTRKISTDSAESELDEEADQQQQQQQQEEEAKKDEANSELSNDESGATSEDETSTAESEEAMETSSESEASSVSEASSEFDDEEFHVEQKKTRRKSTDSTKRAEWEKAKAESRPKKPSSNKKSSCMKRKNGAKSKSGGVQAQGRRCRNSSSKSLNEHEQMSLRVGNSRSKASEPLQCLGPGCVQAAVANSKYCSTDCGMKLAKKRLVMFLKSRVVSYGQTVSLADRVNQKELGRINAEIEALRGKLGELEEKHAELDGLIEKAKYRQINPSIQRERERSLESSEVEVFCVTCGNVLTEKVALKHMDKCFNKVESQAFFGSYFKSNVDGQSIFCDYYNAETKMYCKRLKVICPEHEKEKKISDEEVCGCPLPRPEHILADSETEICLAPKRSCLTHYKWEKLRRAQIDLEKLRTWLRLEELLEQKRLNDASYNHRGGLLSILLHQTSTH